MQEFQSNGIFSPTSCVLEEDETKGIFTCSEEEVLNITFEACDTMGTGEVLASTVMQYLQDMTAQSPERGRLLMLYNMLDPDRQGVAVNRDTFHAAMKRWIVECSQDCMLEEDCQNAETEKNRTHINGNELFAAESEKAFHEGTDGLDHETSDLMNRVADLQYANQKLSEQNSSLLRAVEMCEEANLQLTDEIVTLKSKLTRIRQLELQKVLKDEAEERVSEQNDRAAEAEKGAKEAKKTAAVSWWRAVKVEEEKVKAREEAARLKTRLLETEGRLLQAQRTIEEMESKVTVEEEKVKDREKAARLKKRLLETEERLLQAQRTIEEMGSKSTRLEQMLLESQQRTLTAETRARVAEDKMAATLNITEKKVKAVDQRLAELQEERIKGIQAGEQKVMQALIEADMFKMEVCQLNESSSNLLMKSAKEMEAMKESVSRAAELVSLTERRLAIAKERIDTAEKRIQVTKERAESAAIHLDSVEKGTATNEGKEDSWASFLNKPLLLHSPFFSTASGQHCDGHSTARLQTTLLDALTLELLRTRQQSTGYCFKPFPPYQHRETCVKCAREKRYAGEVNEENVERPKVSTSDESTQTDPEDNGRSQGSVTQHSAAPNTERKHKTGMLVLSFQSSEDKELQYLPQELSESLTKEPTPDLANPAPDLANPGPDLTSPTPDLDNSAPDLANPAPDLTNPAPDLASPAPDLTNPAPDLASSAPDLANPAPDLANPAPDLTNPAPDLASPAPDLTNPAPDLASSAPDLASPAPDLSNPAPDLANPAPDLASPVSRAPGPRYPPPFQTMPTLPEEEEEDEAAEEQESSPPSPVSVTLHLLVLRV
ncbi:Lymphoid-restricted membrane protein [Acipenser ruthenus]|uniref:Lymphoid-restricted membrane protein n=1 Tax=Acipenser ruthenus TaxID=7906 RepID=A0A444UMP8_ACIRT|nr:Lymphoid-restricted membrane protein [Acipenser ruthenus]